MNLVIGITGLDVILEWSSVLDSNSKVVITTLNIDAPYYAAPWLCLDATLIQRQFEIKKALRHFGVTDVSFFDYPSVQDLEFERILAQLQLYIGFYRIANVYCSSKNEILSLVCKSLRGITKVINTTDTLTFMNKQKESALLEFEEIIYKQNWQ